MCVPPDVTADVVAAELDAFPEAIVTDVASVKVAVYESLRDQITVGDAGSGSGRGS